MEKFNEIVVKLREIAPIPSSVDTLWSENDQKEFIEIFKALSKIKTSLQTFVEYLFERDKLNLSEQEYEDYKSKYFLIYQKHKNDIDKVSVLDDVDFCIELIESDHINVAYIMNLIRSIDLEDANKRQKDIDNIRRLIERSSNSELYKKVDLLQAFLDLLEQGLVKNSIDEAYEDFEAKERQKDIDVFLSENDIDREVLTRHIAEYEFSEIIDEGEIRDSITKPMGLLKKKSLVKRIVEFIKKFVEKYQ